ncbi:TIGR03862 family flavoprotein [Mesobaculum littorinae]|uniref:TIGR03862 family flavoprotein n=1 Tax=Mesobaculum littorinae TaxID=2486419 RepID=A0A438AH54_9RHOB|nr:TIGR03862 family flavoprotein [Mesobaculum littorinae]RVV98053.1 TIGR03862 family flavoprotein [Mesobaculum littorinae]
MGDALVIGGGPAGLMAAETLARAGHRVTVAEAKPSFARKLLMAGKSGLNLTKDEAAPAFRAAYGPLPDPVAAALGNFGPRQVMDWAEGLDQTLFTGSTGRVFPHAMKASPLLRAWLGRLEDAGVALRRSWRWTGWEGDSFRFATPQGEVAQRPRATILALGGASWPRLGSDANWLPLFSARGIAVVPFAPANAGLRVAWSDKMAPSFGTPIKGVAFHAGDTVSRGEAVIGRHGLEGGGIYPLGPALRAGAALQVDLCPDLSHADLAARLVRVPRKASVSTRLRRGLGDDPGRLALALECGRPLPQSDALAARLKALPVVHAGLAPVAEAISSAGGVDAAELDPGLMLHRAPGVFVAGEMLDWEAPTGGYLLTACFATGRHAGLSAAAWLDARET